MAAGRFSTWTRPSARWPTTTREHGTASGSARQTQTAPTFLGRSLPSFLSVTVRVCERAHCNHSSPMLTAPCIAHSTLNGGRCGTIATATWPRPSTAGASASRRLRRWSQTFCAPPRPLATLIPFSTGAVTLCRPRSNVHTLCVYSRGCLPALLLAVTLETECDAGVNFRQWKQGTN